MAGERLFVVDDDPFMIELLSESLSEAGYDVTSAQNGADALHSINTHEFEVAIVDLSLPDTDGMDLIRQIADVAPDAQILIMTGYPSLDSAIQALQEGAQDYIVKPFKVPEMLAAVGRALKNQGLQTEVRELRRRVRDLEQEVQGLRAGGARPDARPQAPRSPGLPGAYGTMAGPRPAPQTPPPEEGEET